MDKIQMVDPLGKDGALAPMRSMEQMDRAGNTREKDTREKSVSEMVQEEVENRMTKAAEELQAKYARGEGGRDTSENGPTGAAYTAQHKAEAERRKDMRMRKEAAEMEKEMAERKREAEVRRQVKKMNGEDEDEDEDENPGPEEEDSDEEFLAELESSDDPELARIRNLRLNQIRKEQIALQVKQRAGYGQLTEIVQDEFLPKITKEPRCVVHFYHNDFHRCSIMDHHLQIIAARHPECLFLKVNAEKAPFFCEKLNIMVLPTVIGFFEGKTNPNQRQIGFTDLKPATDERGNPKGEDEWPTSELEEKMGLIGVIDYVKQATEEELRKFGLLEKSSISASRRAVVRGDDDF